MARFSRSFVSARRVACGTQRNVFQRYLSKKSVPLMIILLWGACSKSDLEDCVDPQIKLNEHNLINNSGVKWESDEEARRSYRTACANALGLHGTGKLEEN